LYDARTFKVLQELEFPSDYATPKEKNCIEKEQEKEKETSTTTNQAVVISTEATSQSPRKDDKK